MCYSRDQAEIPVTTAKPNNTIDRKQGHENSKNDDPATNDPPSRKGHLAKYSGETWPSHGSQCALKLVHPHAGVHCENPEERG